MILDHLLSGQGNHCLLLVLQRSLITMSQPVFSGRHDSQHVPCIAETGIGAQFQHESNPQTGKITVRQIPIELPLVTRPIDPYTVQKRFTFDCKKGFLYLRGTVTSKGIIKTEVCFAGMYLGDFVVDLAGVPPHGKAVRIEVSLLVGDGYLSFSVPEEGAVGITSLFDVLGRKFVCDEKLVSIPSEKSS